MDELQRIYRQAVRQRAEAVQAALDRLALDSSAAAAIRREAHALRGSGATYGFPEVSAAAGAAEDASAAELAPRASALLDVLRAVLGPPGARILVVDDDPEMQLLLRTVLGGGGREVVLADGRAQAEAELARGRFALVLLDLLLADGDGRVLLQSVRAADGDVPVVVLSGKQDPAVRAECLSLGANEFIQKPFDPQALQRTVDALLAR